MIPAPLMDWDRTERTGLPEAVLAEAKSAAHLEVLLTEAQKSLRPLLLTRLNVAQYEALPPALRGVLDYDPVSRTAITGPLPPLKDTARVVIVTGGLADLPAATEAARTLRFSGHDSALIADVGVAGLWRLLDRIEVIRSYDVIIAVAGMEGALFSVLAGLVKAPIIALPVSVGHGVTAGGHAALTSALGSCAPGISVVNIDNGFGAAQAAIRILLLTAPRGQDS
ncbi:MULTISPECIES: nickel pincer cofactor biosynthesis protein LarB [unclassified Yoonia]|uniref:nickel pincer cofactor biosynthesis protein LarB n=1 Tax=unclassified Yoonia TaxID=2629118 RepID=UPI002AFF8160|nr:MULTISPECIES: nickel pincer cofactor biosynthesis protein LarB [unclassified Yoonia]